MIRKLFYLLLLIGVLLNTGYAQESLKFTGLIEECGYTFNNDGIKNIVVYLKDHPKTYFYIPVELADNFGFGNMVEHYKKNKSKKLNASSTFLVIINTGFEGRKAEIIADKVPEDKYSYRVTSLKFLE